VGLGGGDFFRGALPLGKQPPVLIRQVAAWTSESTCILRGRNIAFVSVGKRIMIVQLSSLYSIAIQTELLRPTLTSHLGLGLSSVPLSSGFRTKTEGIFHLSMCCMPRPSHCPLYNHFNHTWRKIRITTTLITHFSSTSNFHY
jgi:hypothetical protein